MGKPPVHAVEDDALAVPFDVQDRLRVDKVRGANLEALRDEAAQVFPRGPDAITKVSWMVFFMAIPPPVSD
jgi:hypothetical protein